MYATSRTRKHQCQRVQKHTENVDSLSLFNLLTSPALFQELEEHLPSHRERVFPPTETLSLFMTQVMQADQSCQQIVNQAAIQRHAMGLPACSTHTGAYCKARQRLPLTLVQHLTRYLGTQVCDQVPTTRNARRILLVDGTTVTMPDTAANQAAFPQQGGQRPGLGFPICRLVGVTCLESGALINAAMGAFNGKGTGEQALLRAIQDDFEAGDLLIGDAFYATYFFIAEMMEKGVDLIMEQHGARRRSTDFRRGKRLAERDHLIKISKPRQKPDWMTEQDYQSAPDSITVRECKTGERVLVTTLCDPSIHKSALAERYQQRWQIELDIRQIKDTMGMNILSCKTPEMALKEIWVTLLAYNLIRLLMAQSAILADVQPRQLSFKHCLQLWRTWCQQLQGASEADYILLFKLMAEKRVGNRAGRTEPRAVKRRPKPYPLLTKPRQEARQQVIDFGHPKKLK